jgi:hypothetical protein
MLLLLFLIWFVMTYSYSEVWELLMKYCNKCCVMLNHYDLGCSRFGLKSLAISWTTGVMWAQVWEFNRFGDCFWTCALIIWTVPWQQPGHHGPKHTLSWLSGNGIRLCFFTAWLNWARVWPDGASGEDWVTSSLPATAPSHARMVLPYSPCKL